MKINQLTFSLVFMCFMQFVNAQPVIPAFPGAEGFGANAIGGRGGRIIEVTNLNASGTGSLKAAIDATGPRIVVFRVSGIIRLPDRLFINNPYITIAGQTAPGDGICLRGAGICVSTSNVVIRYIRSRPGDETAGASPSIRDGIEVANPNGVSNVIIDHCSMSWAMDEGASTWYTCNNITYQWCIISETLPERVSGGNGKGMLIGDLGKKISVHHNLFVHDDGRNPKFKGGTTGEIINNVVYNYEYEGTGVQYDLSSSEYSRVPVLINIIGNYYKRGVNSSTSRKGIVLWNSMPGNKIYLQGNVGPGRETDSGEDWNAATLITGTIADYKSTTPAITGSGIVTQTALQARDLVLNNAGALLPKRDAVDTRIVQDVRNNTGAHIYSQGDVGGWPAYNSSTAPADTDHDGMPDTWETQYGFNKTTNDSAADADGDGYTNIEEYLNGTVPVSSGATEKIVDNTSAGFTATGSWTTSTGVSGYWGSNYLHDGDNVANTTDYATWTSPIAVTGNYDVYMRWTSSPDRPDAASVEVGYNGGTDKFKVNQRVGGGTWVKIGTWSFAAGSGDYVQIAADDDGFTIADAVRWVPVAAGATMTTEKTETKLSLSSESSLGLTIIPNPVTSTARLSFTATNSGRAAVMIYNQIGNVMYKKETGVHEGSNNLDVNIQLFDSGIYIVKVILNDKEVATSKLLKE